MRTAVENYVGLERGPNTETVVTDIEILRTQFEAAMRYAVNKKGLLVTFHVEEIKDCIGERSSYVLLVNCYEPLKPSREGQ